MIRARPLAGWVVVAGLAAETAEAHAFQGTGGPYDRFVEGVGVIIAYPGIFLPLLSLGLLLGLWQTDGMVRAWPAFLVAQIVAIPLAAGVGSWVAVVCLALGLGVATLAALLPRHVRWEALGLAALTGLLTVAVSLEGHGFLELPVSIQLGILFGVNVVTAAAAGLAQVCLGATDAGWVRIGVRVAASWIAAVQLLTLAFLLGGAG